MSLTHPLKIRTCKCPFKKLGYGKLPAEFKRPNSVPHENEILDHMELYASEETSRAKEERLRVQDRDATRN